MKRKPVISSAEIETYTLRGPAEIGTYVGDARIAPLDEEPGAFIASVDLGADKKKRIRDMRISTLRLLRSRED